MSTPTAAHGPAHALRALNPAYLLGRALGSVLAPLVTGLADGLFGEPDLDDATYTPIADPLTDVEHHERVHREWLASIDQEVEEMGGTWTLDAERISEIRGDAA